MSISRSKKNILWSYILFIMWPLLAVIRSYRNLDDKHSRVIIVWFFGLFGMNFIYGEDTDSARYRIYFEEIASQSYSDFFRFFQWFSSGDVKMDFLSDVISFLVSRFTENSQIFFMVLALLFGWMVMKNAKLIHNLYAQKKTFIGLLFLIFFLALLSPSRFLSFRHYFALTVFIYGVYNYLQDGKKIYLLLILSTVFIHYAFLMILPFFFLYLLVGNKNIIYYGLVVLSFIGYEYTPEWLRMTGLKLEIAESVDQAVLGYTSETYLEGVSQLEENRIFILKVYIRWTTLFMLFALLFHKLKYKVFDTVSEKLYSFCILFFCFVNFTVSMTSISGRFGVLFQVLCCMLLVRLYSMNSWKESVFFKWISILFISLNTIIILRQTLEFASYLTITPCLPCAFIMESDVLLLELIR